MLLVLRSTREDLGDKVSMFRARRVRRICKLTLLGLLSCCGGARCRWQCFKPDKGFRRGRHGLLNGGDARRRPLGARSGECLSRRLRCDRRCKVGTRSVLREAGRRPEANRQPSGAQSHGSSRAREGRTFFWLVSSVVDDALVWVKLNIDEKSTTNIAAPTIDLNPWHPRGIPLCEPAVPQDLRDAANQKPR